MTGFTLLPYDNSVVFEDGAISVRGFSGGRVWYSDEGATVFFAVVSGAMSVNGYNAFSGMFGTVDAQDLAIAARGHCRAMMVKVKDYRCMFLLSGPVELKGRLSYINGSTNTGIIAPYMQGDPCLNYLHFPMGIIQDPHTHPSHRIGVVYGGNGICHTEEQDIPMRPGCMFLIPANTLHWFETDNAAMRIITFHPSSSFGATNESHQMLDETIIKEISRLS